MDRIHAMQVFATVLERHSLSGAAQELGISLPSVSRVLGQFERELGVRLIARTTRGLVETDSGKAYYQRCRQILDEIREADIEIQHHARAASGELRVTAPVTFGRHHIAPAAPAFLQQHTRLSLNLSLTDSCVSLTEQRFDVAIRVAVLRNERLAARKLGYVQHKLVGSAEYFARRGVPEHPHDLSRHDCLHFTPCLRTDEWHFSHAGRTLAVKVRGRMRANNQGALLDAANAGAGIALLPAWLVRRPIESGDLMSVLEAYEPPRTPVHAIFPTQGAPPHKVRAFVEFLAQRFREQGTLLPDPSTPRHTPKDTLSRHDMASRTVSLEAGRL
jgi:DNA-binding transcriptional LysR family regulator